MRFSKGLGMGCCGFFLFMVGFYGFLWLAGGLDLFKLMSLCFSSSGFFMFCFSLFVGWLVCVFHKFSLVFL